MNLLPKKNPTTVNIGENVAYIEKELASDNELIRRSDAIKAFEGRSFAVRDLHTAKAIIRSIKAVEPKYGEWTPCSERPPETDGDYLATLHCKWPDREYKTVEVEEFRNGGFDENLYVKVVAWMPLPEPWKGADDESQ